MRRSFPESLAPRFSELDLFIIAYSLALTTAYYFNVLNPSSFSIGVVPDFYTLTSKELMIGAYAVLTVVISYVLLILHHVFSTRLKSQLEKRFLIFTTMCILVFATFSLVPALKANIFNVLLIGWNFIYLYLFSMTVRDARHDRALLNKLIPDEGSNARFVPLTIGVFFTLFILMTYVFKMSGIVTFALLVALSMPIRHTITKYNFGNEKTYTLRTLGVFVLSIMVIWAIRFVI
jgi:hypothetical protein